MDNARLILACAVGIAAILGCFALGKLPDREAFRRDHPARDAIRALGYIGALLLVPAVIVMLVESPWLWTSWSVLPGASFLFVANIWAMTRPVVRPYPPWFEPRARRPSSAQLRRQLDAQRAADRERERRALGP